VSSLRELQKKLDEGEVPRVLLLHGDEPHFMEQAGKAIRRTLFPEPEAEALGLVRLECPAPRESGTLSVSRVLEELQTVPMLGGARLVEVIHAERLLKDQGEELVAGLGAYLTAKNTSGHLVLKASGKIGRMKGSLQKKGAFLLECKRLYDTPAPWKKGREGAVSETAQWLAGEARSRGHALDPADAEILVRRLGGGLARLEQELDKLSVLVGEKRPIPRSAIEAGLGEGSERGHDSFRLADAVVAGRAREALVLLHEIFSEGLTAGSGDRSGRITQPPAIALMLLSALFHRYRKLAAAARMVAAGRSPAVAAEALGLAGFAARRLADELRDVRLADVEAAIPLFRVTERHLKGGSPLHPRIILERLIVDLTAGRSLPAGVRLGREDWRT